MRRIWDFFMESEPVAVGATLAVVLSTAVEFGLPLTARQEDMVQTCVVAVLAFIVRKQVTSTRTIHDAGLRKRDVVAAAETTRALRADQR